jgi:putative ABC transport system permease protein
VVVGVTGDVRHTSLASPPFREAYIPLDQSPLFSYDLVVRTAIRPRSIIGDVKKAIWSLDHDESAGTLRTVDEVVDLGLIQPKFRGYVLGGFAGMAVILSGAGLYGLLAFIVSQRGREIGVRMSLGALPADILRMLMGRAVWLTLTCISIGLFMAFGFARLMSTLVYGIALVDPVTFMAGPAILLLVSILASYVPARRAMSLNPVDVLRSE